MVPQTRSEINVTPLVDVALVVLIIFMVVTPLIEQGPDVVLPATRGPETLPQSAAQVALTLRADGAVFLDEMPIVPGALLGALRGRGLEGATIVVRADARLPYGEVRELLELLAGEGVESAGLVTVREPAPPEV